MIFFLITTSYAIFLNGLRFEIYLLWIIILLSTSPWPNTVAR